MTGHDDLNDPLDELFRSAADTATRPAKPVPPAHFVPAVERAFTEACSRCGGSGFWAYGRVCFKCSGDGKQVFKTSADDREKARNRASQKRVEKGQQIEMDRDAFYAREPQVKAWLEAECSRPEPFAFAVAMVETLNKFGDLTERQLETCRRLAAKAALRKAERAAAREAAKAAAPVADVAGINRLKAAFDQAIAYSAAKGLTKHPRITVGDLTISPAKANSANPGALYVKERGEYLGKVADGRFVSSYACTAGQRAKVMEFLANPAAAAKVYGQETGICCVCNAVLRSEWRLRGIGPICAEKFGWA